jgi:hypothetical protein
MAAGLLSQVTCYWNQPPFSLPPSELHQGWAEIGRLDAAPDDDHLTSIDPV